jgi:hypothetical protein
MYWTASLNCGNYQPFSGTFYAINFSRQGINMAAKTFTLFKDNFRLDYGRLPTLEETWKAAQNAVEKKFTAQNTGSPKSCPHWQVYNQGCSGEFGACDCNGDLERAKLRAGA